MAHLENEIAPLSSSVKKEIRNKLDGLADKVTFHRDGSIEIRFGFFYRHGMTTETCKKNVLAVVPDAKFVEDECFENWQPWPRDSYFKITFKI